MSCIHEEKCKNAAECYRCFNLSLLSLDKVKVSQKSHSMSRATSSRAKATDEDSWKNLEQEVADALNDVPSIEESRRSRASGALWFEKCDVVDEIVAPECKERQGNVLTGGDKSLSFKQEWLTKARAEAQENDKIMILPFRFKKDPNTYVAMYTDDIMELITTAKSYLRDNDVKDAQLKGITNAIADLKDPVIEEALSVALLQLEDNMAVLQDVKDRLQIALKKITGADYL